MLEDYTDTSMMVYPEYESRHKLEKSLLAHIAQYPGIRYRQLLRMTNSCHGVLSYHLAELEHSNIIKADRTIGVTRFYLVDVPLEVSKVIGYIKNNTSRQILSTLVHQGPCTFNELTEITKKTSSTIFWHLKRLVENGVINKMKPGGISGIAHKPIVYTVGNKAFVLEVLQKYWEAPVAKVVNNYSQIMDNLC